LWYFRPPIRPDARLDSASTHSVDRELNVIAIGPVASGTRATRSRRQTDGSWRFAIENPRWIRSRDVSSRP
jgi:hypothetical protein